MYAPYTLVVEPPFLDYLPLLLDYPLLRGTLRLLATTAGSALTKRHYQLQLRGSNALLTN